jgi:hypothetical protein
LDFWGEFFSRIFWRIFWGGIFSEEFFGGIFCRIFLGGFFWKDFWRGFFGEEFFGRNSLVDFYKELMLLSRFWGNFVSMEGRRRRILDP